MILLTKTEIFREPILPLLIQATKLTLIRRRAPATRVVDLQKFFKNKLLKPNRTHATKAYIIEDSSLSFEFN